MPRRRGRARDTVEEAVAEQEDVQEPQADEVEDMEEEVADNNDEPPMDADELKSLQFNQELSWRPAKPIASGTLVARLESLSKELAEFDQGDVDLESVKDVAEKLAHRNLIQHKDKGVKAYTACCLVDILRLYVPDAPFTGDQLKMMFGLFVKDILPALHDPTDPYNIQHKYVLVSLTEVKSILLLSDIHGADDLLLRLFNSTFDGVSNSAKSKTGEEVAKDVEIHLTEMLIQLIDESPGSIPASVIDAIISQFMRAAPPGGSRSKEQNGNQSTLLHKTEPPAYIMARNICNGCSDKMSRYVSQYFGDVILNASGFATKANGNRQGDDSDDEDENAGPSEADLKSLRQAHLLIRELWRAAPDILQNVVPQIDAELSADNVYLRQIATETFGDMISGIGAAGPPPAPVLDPTLYPPLRLADEPPPSTGEANTLTTPFSPHSFAQTHTPTYRNFVGRKNDKVSTIRAAWATAVGYILSTSAGGIGLSRVEENELVKALGEKLNDSEEKVRLAAVKAIELFDFRDIILKLGASGGMDKEGSIFADLSDRMRDKRPAVRVEALVLLGKLWAVGAGEIAQSNEAVTACLGSVPTKIVNLFYVNDPDLNILLDRVLHECLVPLKFPLTKGKDTKTKSSTSDKKGPTQSEQDTIRAERILLMLKSLNPQAQKAFFAMQGRQPQFAQAVGIFIKNCESYRAGNADGDAQSVKRQMEAAIHWFGQNFPDPLKVRTDLQKLAKLNDRRVYQLIKYAIESESEFQKVRRSIHELIPKIQSSSAATSLDTLIPLLYRSSSLMFNRSHLATIMDYSKSDKDGLAAVANSILHDISTRNPDLFKAHSEELRKSIIDQTPTEGRANDPGVVDILKAYSSYASKYPDEVKLDKSFVQTLTNYALHGRPWKAAKYAVNLLLVKADDKSKVTATNLLKKVMKDLKYESPNLLNKLATISQLERLVPTVTADVDDAVSDLTIKEILRQVRTDATRGDASWTNDPDLNEEIQAKSLALKILVNRALATADEADAEERVKPIFKLLKTFVIHEGEFCKVKDTPLYHKKRLRLLAGQSILKLCTVKKYDDQFDHASFHKLAELVQDSEIQVRRRFMDKLQGHLAQGQLRPRFYAILFLVAFEPVTDVKDKVETWLRSRAHFYVMTKKPSMEAMVGHLIPLLAHHPDYSREPEDLQDFAKYILFYLSIVATENNIGLIQKYVEKVKGTRDALSPEASENLYVLSDLAQAVLRKYQEKRNWSFQAWPQKVGLPAGLYAPLPSSEVAHEIAMKQYIPEELDESLDDLIRAHERKKKRKSVHDGSEHPAKKPKNQMKTVIREKPIAKPKSAKAAAAKKKKKAAARPKKDDDFAIPASERRRSGRTHESSNYRERDDDEDEEEMLEGVAEWDYGEGDDDDDDSALSGAPSGEEEEGSDEEGSEAESPAKPQKKPANRSSTAKSGSRTSRSRASRGAAKSDSDMDVDDE